MKKIVALLTGFVISFSTICTAQKIYSINVSGISSSSIPAPLKLGGQNPKGESIAVNNDYILINEQPFFPIMGEFHFSRYPHQYWEESILKMKAGGINIIATYVFWILHEPAEGKFDWSGDRNLSEFAALCAKHNMFLIVRVGPYGHGEIRNGAIPDWLYGRPIQLRTDDPAYLSIVKRYFSEIGLQLKGKLYKDGGNVIGIQLENEYQHAGSAWWLNYPGSGYQYTFPYNQQSLTRANVYNIEKKEQYKASGDQHMLTLKKIAEEAGLLTPLYTATGWGYAAIAEKESLPVSAAYAFPSWGKLEPSPFYLFKDLRKEPDYAPVRYNALQYPALSAEIGSGIMITNSKRPEVPFNSITPLMIRNIGSGSNGIGYYMFHGGSTPVQNGQFMSEEPGELPKISYDFQAPVGEFGQVRLSYKDLVPLHFFLNNFSTRLVPMNIAIPATNPVNALDNKELRYAVRSDGKTGFIFLHNYQDHAVMNDQKDIQLSIVTKTGVVKIPEQGNLTLLKEKHAIFPFNLQLNDLLIRYATVQPMTSFTKEGTRYNVFVSIDGIEPEFYLQGKITISGDKSFSTKKKADGIIIKGKSKTVFSFSTGSGKNKDHFLVIPMSMAENAYQLKTGLAFTKQTLLADSNGFELINRGNAADTLLFYPALKSDPVISNASINLIRSVNNQLSAYQVVFTPKTPMVKIEQPLKTNAVIHVGENFLDGLNDVFLKIDYTGDKGQAFLDGHLIADHFYYGAPWEIGLKRFAQQLKYQPLYLFFHAIKKDAACLEYFTNKIPFGDAPEYLNINSITIIPEYKCKVEVR